MHRAYQVLLILAAWRLPQCFLAVRGCVLAFCDWTSDPDVSHLSASLHCPSDFATWNDRFTVGIWCPRRNMPRRKRFRFYSHLQHERIMLYALDSFTIMHGRWYPTGTTVKFVEPQTAGRLCTATMPIRKLVTGIAFVLNYVRMRNVRTLS